MQTTVTEIKTSTNQNPATVRAEKASGSFLRTFRSSTRKVRYTTLDTCNTASNQLLPIISLGFANVLSEVVEDEEAPNPELIQLNETIKSLREQLRESERRVKATEEKVKAAEEKTKTAEERFGTVTDMAKALFGENKQERILFARKQWKDLPNSAIAVIAESSPAYVSEVLKSTPN